MTVPTFVVGVDGTPASRSALRVAIDEATLRHGRVVLVVCWSKGAAPRSTRPAPHELDSAEKAAMIAQAAIASVAATSQERAHIVTSTSEGGPGPALVLAGRDADLLVIGSTTRGPIARHSGKTVVDHCLRHSDIPVLVVPYAPAGVEDVDIDRELLDTSGGEGSDIPVRYDPAASLPSSL